MMGPDYGLRRMRPCKFQVCVGGRSGLTGLFIVSPAQGHVSRKTFKNGLGKAHLEWPETVWTEGPSHSSSLLRVT